MWAYLKMIYLFIFKMGLSCGYVYDHYKQNDWKNIIFIKILYWTKTEVFQICIRRVMRGYNFQYVSFYTMANTQQGLQAIRWHWYSLYRYSRSWLFSRYFFGNKVKRHTRKRFWWRMGESVGGGHRKTTIVKCKRIFPLWSQRYEIR